MNTDVTAIILSGGRSSRFGGEDKAWAVWREKPLIRHVVDRLTNQVSTIVINANQRLEEYRQLGFHVVKDNFGEPLGPLAGLQAAQSKVFTPWALLVPNDTPKLPLDLVPRLIKGAVEVQATAAFPKCGDQNHYLPLLIHSSRLESVDIFLENGGRSIHQWLAGTNVTSVEFSDETDAFSNINTQSALKNLG